jgi:putative iron-dependent peroxidase
MSTPQGGIFALGTASDAYLELDARGGTAGELVGAVASLHEPRTTMGGVNLVAGFRPELWREAAPGDAPAAVDGFDEPLAGRTASPCPRRSTMRSCGSREAPMTWSSTSREPR